MKHYLKKFAESIYFDLLGVALVVGIAIYSGYLNTRLDQFVDWGPYTSLIPLGLISVINVGFSMISTRLTGRIHWLGNIFGIVNVALSGAIDYILGNKAAPITYLITFIIYSVAIKQWQKSREGKANVMNKEKQMKVIIVLTIGSFIISYASNYFGYGGNMNLLAYVTTVAFALSLIANGLNAFKLTTQYHFWLIYNFVQLLKAFVQGNFANVGKYIFYIINSIGSLFLWNDSETQEESK